MDKHISAQDKIIRDKLYEHHLEGESIRGFVEPENGDIVIVDRCVYVFGELNLITPYTVVR